MQKSELLKKKVLSYTVCFLNLRGSNLKIYKILPFSF